MTEEQNKMNIAKLKHRKAVRRDYFRRQAIAKKIVDRFLLRPGVFTGDDRGGVDGERSVAGPGQGSTGAPSLPSSDITGAKFLISGRKTMPERDDGNKAQTDQLRPSSGAEAFSDSSKNKARHQVEANLAISAFDAKPRRDEAILYSGEIGPCCRKPVEIDQLVPPRYGRDIKKKPDVV